MSKKPKIIVVLGPTATGKSDLAVRLAKKFNGEIISADSRQVYKGLNVGTGKISKKEMSGIKHYLLDVENPKKQFSVAQYKKLAEKAIRKILAKQKLPIITGGTGLYIQALVDNVSFPEVLPNKKLRKELNNKSVKELFIILNKLDPERAVTIDKNNPRRLIRAIEIARQIGKVPPLNYGFRRPDLARVGTPTSATAERRDYKLLFIGLDLPNETLKERINIRLKERLKKGMVREAKTLHKQGLSLKRMDELGLEYRYLAKFLKKEITKTDLIKYLEKEIWHYAKRQRTWFKKDQRINWFNPTRKTGFKKIENQVKNFLNF